MQRVFIFFFWVLSGSFAYSQPNSLSYEQLALDYFCDSILRQDPNFMYRTLSFSGVVSDEATFLQSYDIERFELDSTDIVWPDSLEREIWMIHYSKGQLKCAKRLDSRGIIKVKPDPGTIKRTTDAYLIVHSERVLRGRHFVQISCNSRTDPSSAVIIEISEDGK